MARVQQILPEELRQTLAFLGKPIVASLDRSEIRRPDATRARRDQLRSADAAFAGWAGFSSSGRARSNFTSRSATS